MRIVVRHFGDQHLDQHLPNRAVELIENLLDLRIVDRLGAHQKRVGVGVGDDGDLAGKARSGLGGGAAEPAESAATETTAAKTAAAVGVGSEPAAAAAKSAAAAKAAASAKA